jgi:3-oxoacyl-[acyl-carrier-protein] synthase II
VTREVVITGLGAVSALGRGVDALLAGLTSGRSAIGPLVLLPYEGRCRIAAEVRDDVPPGDELAPATRRRLSRPDRFALAAVREALGDAGLDAAARRDAALVVGATTGGMRETEAAYQRWRTGAAPRLPLSQALGTPLACAAAAVSHAFGLYGAQETVSTACSSSALAVGRAADLVRHGETPVAIAIGTDALCLLTQSGFDALQALDPQGCRPFDRNRHGLTLGEGAAALVLEDAAHARARGARMRARFLGWGSATDAHHPTAPHPEGAGALAAMRRALAAAGVPSEAVDYVNAHGTGTPQNDATEIAVLRAVLGARAVRVPVSSTKSQIGHCLGAAGALEAVVTVLALEHGLLPPTVGLREPDPVCADMDLVPSPGRRAALGTAITSSYGFGGHNVTLVLARGDET